MERGINYATAELERDLVDRINASGLPAVNVRLLLQNLLQQARVQEAEAVKQEKEESKAAEKEADSAKEAGHGGQTDQ